MSQVQSRLKSWLGRLSPQTKDAESESQIPPRLLDNSQVRPRVKRLLDALGERMFPAGGAIPYSAHDVQLTEYTLDFLGKIPANRSDMLCVLMLAYEYGFPVLYGKGLRFSQMSEESQMELLESLHHSNLYPIRILNICLRMFLTFGYLADERVLKEMGFFKKYAYPKDSRAIQIIKDLPWEKYKTQDTADAKVSEESPKETPRDATQQTSSREQAKLEVEAQ